MEQRRKEAAFIGYLLELLARRKEEFQFHVETFLFGFQISGYWIEDSRKP